MIDPSPIDTNQNFNLTVLFQSFHSWYTPCQLQLCPKEPPIFQSSFSQEKSPAGPRKVGRNCGFRAGSLGIKIGFGDSTAEELI